MNRYGAAGNWSLSLWSSSIPPLDSYSDIFYLEGIDLPTTCMFLCPQSWVFPPKLCHREHHCEYYCYLKFVCLIVVLLYPRDMWKTCLFILNRTSKTDESNDSIEIILMSQWVYWPVSKRSKRRGNLQVTHWSPYSVPHNVRWHHKSCFTEHCLQLTFCLLHTPSSTSHMQLSG